MLIDTKNMNWGFPTERPRLGCLQGNRSNSPLAITLILFSLAVPAAIAQSAKPSEYDVKAAYLLNFGKFIRQSNGRYLHSSFDICLLGRDSMGQTIDELATNQFIDNRPVHVRRLPDVTQAKGCAIVYFS